MYGPRSPLPFTVKLPHHVTKIMLDVARLFERHKSSQAGEQLR
jgi:hypothetical protein